MVSIASVGHCGRVGSCRGVDLDGHQRAELCEAGGGRGSVRCKRGDLADHMGKAHYPLGGQPRGSNRLLVDQLEQDHEVRCLRSSARWHNTFEVIPADGHEALNQKEKTDKLFTITWHVTAEKKDSARQVKVLPY